LFLGFVYRFKYVLAQPFAAFSVRGCMIPVVDQYASNLGAHLVQRCLSNYLKELHAGPGTRHLVHQSQKPVAANVKNEFCEVPLCLTAIESNPSRDLQTIRGRSQIV